jgi:CubicO group peptidase (beta-lactamase class C family)
MKALFLLSFSVFFSFTSHAQIQDSLREKVDAIFDEYKSPSTPGCALALVKDGEIIYKKGYGTSNLEYGIPITPTSIFHVASISKQFTAAAIIMLSLEGKLSLNEDIRKYLPEVPDFGHVITFNHLIHHTSGIRDQWDLQELAGWRDGDLITEDDVLEMLHRQVALNFIPGSEYYYCNTSYTILGVAVKRITGVSLREYSDSVFFKPLGMVNSHFHSDHSEVTPNRTSAYQKDEQGNWKIYIPVFDNYGATSLFTTVEDLSKWDENFYSKRVGGPAFISAILENGILNNGTKQAYAGGISTESYKGFRTEQHSGADAGYRSNFIRFPDQHFSVILLANHAESQAMLLSQQVADVFLEIKKKEVPDAIFAIDSSIVKGWVGTYIDALTKRRIEMNFENGKLILGSTKLLSLSNFEFSLPGSSTKLFFSKELGVDKFCVTNPNAINRNYKRVVEVDLQPSEFLEFIGEYYCAELDAKYIVTANDSVLFVKIPRNNMLEFYPFAKDEFSGNFFIQFSRGKRKKVDGFYLTTGRVRNLYFQKIKK